jgi:glycerol-3-phosphate cytidylyltransferase-like family protein
MNTQDSTDQAKTDPQQEVENRKAWVEQQPFVKDVLTKAQVLRGWWYAQYDTVPWKQDLDFWHNRYETSRYWNKHKNLIDQLKRLTDIDVLSAIDRAAKAHKEAFREDMIDYSGQFDPSVLDTSGQDSYHIRPTVPGLSGQLQHH